MSYIRSDLKQCDTFLVCCPYLDLYERVGRDNEFLLAKALQLSSWICNL